MQSFCRIIGRAPHTLINFFKIFSPWVLELATPLISFLSNVSIIWYIFLIRYVCTNSVNKNKQIDTILYTYSLYDSTFSQFTWGTCAGLILLSNNIYDNSKSPVLSVSHIMYNKLSELYIILNIFKTEID